MRIATAMMELTVGVGEGAAMAVVGTFVQETYHRVIQMNTNIVEMMKKRMAKW